MINPLGGREPIIKNARQTCVILGEEERNAIAELKGDSSISEFIRNSIMMRHTQSESSSDDLKRLKEENIRMSLELRKIKRKEKVTTKDHENNLLLLAQGFQLYLENNKRSENPIARRDWINTRCKGTDVTPTDFIVYIEEKGLISK
jgi:hypothetical protein